MEIPTATSQKKGLGSLAWVGIGCGAIVVLGAISTIVLSLFFAPEIKQYVNEENEEKRQEFAKEVQKNPTRATASMMVTASGGQFEMVAEDDANKRYTVKEKRSGKLTTIYWSEKKQAPEVIPGGFSAIP